MRALVLVLFAAALAAPATRAADVTITVTKAEADGRAVYVQLCTETEFLKKCGLRDRQMAKSESLTFVFKDVAPGFYAATAFQDMNDNAKLDRGMFGEPSEPWAISRDAKGVMGPPVFADAQVEVTDQSLSLKMKLD